MGGEDAGSGSKSAKTTTATKVAGLAAKIRDSKSRLVDALAPQLDSAEVAAVFQRKKTIKDCRMLVERLLTGARSKKGKQLEAELVRNSANFEDVLERALAAGVGATAKKNLRHWRHVQEVHKYNSKGKAGKKFRKQVKGKNKTLRAQLVKKDGKKVLPVKPRR